MGEQRRIELGYLYTTRYAYDAEGHLRYVVSGEGRVTEYRYNTAGRRVAAITYSGGWYDVSALAPEAAITLTQLKI